MSPPRRVPHISPEFLKSLQPPGPHRLLKRSRRVENHIRPNLLHLGLSLGLNADTVDLERIVPRRIEHAGIELRVGCEGVFVEDG